jgi:hypothetical protein
MVSVVLVVHFIVLSCTEERVLAESWQYLQALGELEIKRIHFHKVCVGELLAIGHQLLLLRCECIHHKQLAIGHKVVHARHSAHCCIHTWEQSKLA